MKRCRLKIMHCGSCRHPEFLTRKNAALCAADYPSLVGLIEHPDEGLILFDTGYDQAFLDATKTFPERLYRWMTPVTLPGERGVSGLLKKMGYRPEDITSVIISHFHGDHVAGLHNFPNARVICSRPGLGLVHAGSRLSRTRRGILSALAPSDLAARARFFEDSTHVTLPEAFRPFSQAADILNDGSLLAVELPGHCPGHWGLALRTPDDRFAFLVADAAWSIRAVEDNTPPPMVTTKLLGFTGDYYRTLGHLNTIHREGRDIFLLPSHCAAAAKRFEGEQA
jgi:glyoxylase-like metal-dependent hydrolase (beta-lactamase superfamily II)